MPGLAIGRDIFFDARLILLDEPCTALAVRAVEKVLSFIREVRDRGAFAGGINGVIVVYIGVPSIITTIGTQFFWRETAFHIALAGRLSACTVSLVSGVRIYGVDVSEQLSIWL